MVRITTVLARVPVIKFRKGGLGSGAAHPTPNSASAAQVANPAQASATVHAQPAAAMSTGTIADTDLPLKYQRQPLSEEEIAYINGGGVV